MQSAEAAHHAGLMFLGHRWLRLQRNPETSRGGPLISKVSPRAGLILVLVIVATGCVAEQPAPPAADCVPEEVHEVMELATTEDPDIVVNCNLSVPSGSVITKRLIVQGSEGSGVTIDCNGATIDGSAVPELSEANARSNMILIRSTGSGDPQSPTWSRPTDVTVRDCKVIGAVRVLGMTDLANLRISSYEPSHVESLRRIAPTRITFDNLTITGRARTPLYIGAGVTYSKLINSELNGEAESVGLYLDAESSRSLIKNSYIHTESPREVLAIDASNYNTIIDNRFSSLSRGGIYLYRNCGEKGIVRHTTPSHNTIVNNVFYYNDYSPNPYSVNPSVYLGSRNGSPGYCDDDDGHTIGSGASNLDYAQSNVVMQNQIYKLPGSLMIKEGESTDSPNYIKYNTTVTTPIARLAGCYVPNGYFTDFIVHGESIEVFRHSNGESYTGGPYTCYDGRLTA